MNKSTLVVFDFDGTITRKDTLLEFIKYSKGKILFYIGFLIYSPLLVLMKLHLYPNWKAKQKVFTYFYKGTNENDFNQQCQSFFAENKHLIYSEARERIMSHKSKGDKVIIITASMENWVKCFAEWLNVDEVIGTKLEIIEGALTGRFLTKNCYGQEKVNRLLELYPNRNDYELVVYGDSRGDKEILAIADKKEYKSFTK